MTDQRESLKLHSTYYFHFTKCIFIGMGEHKNSPHYKFVYRNEYDRENSIIVHSLEQGYFISLEGNILPIRITGSSHEEIKRYDRRIKEESKKYADLNRILEGAEL